MACMAPLGMAMPDLRKGSHIQIVPDLSAQQAESVIYYSLRMGGLLRSLSMRVKNTISFLGVFLNLAHNA